MLDRTRVDHLSGNQNFKQNAVGQLLLNCESVSGENKALPELQLAAAASSLQQIIWSSHGQHVRVRSEHKLP
jgi:hypothetical protein